MKRFGIAVAVAVALIYVVYVVISVARDFSGVTFSATPSPAPTNTPPSRTISLLLPLVGLEDPSDCEAAAKIDMQHSYKGGVVTYDAGTRLHIVSDGGGACMLVSDDAGNRATVVRSQFDADDRGAR